MSNAGAPRPCGICALNDRIRAGRFPDFVAELANSYVILGDAQFYRGYCILFAKVHETELFRMRTNDAHALFEEVVKVAESIAAVTSPWKLNYECLGNQEPHVHWHLFPRYESDALRHAPVWMRPDSERKVALADDDRRGLIAALREQIRRRLPDARIPDGPSP
ncbi:MAG: HIT family protein [Candidatus Binataceae bacterium]